MSGFVDQRALSHDALSQAFSPGQGTVNQGGLSRAAAWLLEKGRVTQAHLMSFERLDLLLVMSLLLMLLYTTRVVTILAIAGLLYRPLARHPLFWVAIAALMAARLLTCGRRYLGEGWAVTGAVRTAG